MFNAITGGDTTSSQLLKVMLHDLFPLMDKALSLHSLGQTTQAFGLVMLSQIKDLTRDHSGPISLKELTNDPLFTTANLILLGSAFSADTYKDFQTLNKSIPYRLSGTLLWPWPSNAARTRLLESIADYLQRGQVTDCDNPFSRGFMKVFKDNNLQNLAGAKLVLHFMWGARSNTLNNAFFSLSFLLAGPDGLARVRAEIDAAVDTFGGLEALLKASPSELDDPAFKLLTSAIMETMRFTSLHATRLATCDFDLRLGDGTTIPIQKGERVFGDIRAAHMDMTVFPNPEKFVVDRFAQHPYKMKHLPTEGYLFHSLGGGKHLVSTYTCWSLLPC